VAESDIHAVVVAEHRDVAADRLIDLALRAGAPDNVTVIVADLTTP
jgi:protein phosphatase